MSSGTIVGQPSGVPTASGPEVSTTSMRQCSTVLTTVSSGMTIIATSSVPCVSQSLGEMESSTGAIPNVSNSQPVISGSGPVTSKSAPETSGPESAASSPGSGPAATGPGASQVGECSTVLTTVSGGATIMVTSTTPCGVQSSSGAPTSNTVPAESHSETAQISPYQSNTQASTASSELPVSQQTSGHPAAPTLSTVASTSPIASSLEATIAVTTISVPCTHHQCQSSVYVTTNSITVPTPTESGQCMSGTTVTSIISHSFGAATITQTFTIPCGSSIYQSPGASNNPGSSPAPIFSTSETSLPSEGVSTASELGSQPIPSTHQPGGGNSSPSSQSKPPTGPGSCSTVMSSVEGSTTVLITTAVPCGEASKPGFESQATSAPETGSLTSALNTENTLSSPTGTTETSPEQSEPGTVTRGSLTGPEVVTIGTMFPSTSCPTSELTYMIMHGSSTLVEEPSPTSSITEEPQEATVNPSYLQSSLPGSEAAASSPQTPSPARFESNGNSGASVIPTQSIPMMANKATKVSSSLVLSFAMSILVLLI